MGTLAEADRAVVNAEKTLNKAFVEYRSHRSSQDKGAFLALKLQASLVQYEICSDFAALVRMRPSEFARKVFLKNTIHKIVEYTETMRAAHLRKIISLAESRGLNNAAGMLRHLGSELRRGLNTEQFRPLRNKASGHYDANIKDQVDLIDGMDEDTMLDTVTSFLTINIQILSVLKAIGANQDVESLSLR